MESILYEVSDGIATVTLNRPDKLNALNETISVEIAKAVTEASGDATVRTIVITGAGRAFCAGADLEQLSPFYTTGRTPPISEVLRDRYNPIVGSIMGSNKPVIASVNGVAAGAGASLALACDFRIASDKSRIFQAFIKIGLIPDSGATWFLPRLVGTAKALELAMIGDQISSEEALRLGLVTKVVPADDLVAETRAFAEKLAAGPTHAYALTRKAILFGAVHDLAQTMDFEADLQQELAASPDHIEGVKAFLEKREANFQGR